MACPVKWLFALKSLQQDKKIVYHCMVLNDWANRRNIYMYSKIDKKAKSETATVKQMVLDSEVIGFKKK